MKKNDKANERVKKKGKNRFLLIFVSAFLAVTLIFGTVLIVISARRTARAAVSYNGATVTTGVANYFASYYKYIYMQELVRAGVERVEDYPAFWNKTAEDGKTYREHLDKGIRECISKILIANTYFDKYVKLTKGEKEKLEGVVTEIIEDRAGGSEKKFAEQIKEYGFNLKDFRTAVKMLYKASLAASVVYGNDGSGVAADSEFCNEYLSEYSHTKFFFIRTVDEDVYYEDGSYEVVELGEEEKAKRLAVCEEIRSYIKAREEGADKQMDEAMFNAYLETYDTQNEDVHADGYYLHPNSTFSAAVAETYSTELVEKIFSMTIDSYSYIETEFGVWFIYKYDVTPNAYSSGAVTACFSDFYLNAAAKHFDDSLNMLIEDVVFNEKYEKLNVTERPKNYLYIPNF